MDGRVLVLLTLGAAFKAISLGYYFIVMLLRASGTLKTGTNLLGEIIADQISLIPFDMDWNANAMHTILKVGLPQ